MDLGIFLLIALLSLILTLSIQSTLTRWLIPYPLFLTVLGFASSEGVTALGMDTGVRYHNFPLLMNYVFLPVLIFQIALNMRVDFFKREWGAIVGLSTIGVFVMLLVVTLVLFYGINHPVGFPWIGAGMTAALLSATHFIPIKDLFADLKFSPKIATLLEAESLFSDVLAVTVFNVFLNMALSNTREPSLGYWISMLLYQCATGVVLGGIVSGLAKGLLTRLPDDVREALVLLLLVYAGYLLAEMLVHGAGIITVFMAGIISRHYLQAQATRFVLHFWDLLKWLATMGLFFLIGVTVTVDMFSHRWLAMLIGIAAVVLARCITVYGFFGVGRLWQRQPVWPLREQTIVAFSGMRGAIAIALAFSIPTQLSYWWTIQSIVFGVVLFTWLVQAPLIARWAAKTMRFEK